jgi:hypothetical protein
MSISCVLVGSDQCRRSQQDLRVPLYFCDPVVMADEKRLDVTPVPGKQNIITVRVGERRRTFDLEGNVLFGEIPPECQLHHCPGYHTPEMLVRRTSHPVIEMRQRMKRVGNPAFSEVARVGQVEKVRRG